MLTEAEILGMMTGKRQTLEKGDNVAGFKVRHVIRKN